MVLSLVDRLLCTESLISNTVPSPQKAAGSGFAAVPKAYQDNVISYVDIYIWDIYIYTSGLNYNISLTWILRPAMGMTPLRSLVTMVIVRENRVRSWWNLPKFLVKSPCPWRSTLTTYMGKYIWCTWRAHQWVFIDRQLDQFHHFLFSKAKWKTSAQISSAQLHATVFPPRWCAIRLDPAGNGFFSWSYCMGCKYPPVNVYITDGKITMFHGKTHYKWWFSIVMLVYQRVPEGKFWVGPTPSAIYEGLQHAFNGPS